MKKNILFVNIKGFVMNLFRKKNIIRKATKGKKGIFTYDKYMSDIDKNIILKIIDEHPDWAHPITNKKSPTF